MGGLGVPLGPLCRMGESVNLSAAACAAAGLPTLQDLEAMLVGGAMVGARASRLTLAGAHLQERGVRSIAYALSIKGTQACRLTHLDLQVSPRRTAGGFLSSVSIPVCVVVAGLTWESRGHSHPCSPVGAAPETS